jgi:hypothetical protein
MNFETELRRALVRREPPPGFAGRVLDRVKQSPEPMETAFYRVRTVHRPWRALAAATLLGLVLAGWTSHAVHQRRVEGEHAREQVLFALRIAGTKMAHAQREVREIGNRHVER